MSATTLLTNRNKSILERRFIYNTLNANAKQWEATSQRLFNSFNFKSNDIRSKRSFTVTDDTLEYTHLMKERFIDMKRIQGRTKKQYPIHNKVVMGYFNNIIFQLQVGFTQSVKAQLAQELKIQI